MKKKLFIGGLLAMVLLVMGAAYTLQTAQYEWDSIGETTTAYITPDTDERDYTNFVANHPDAIIHVFDPYRINMAEFRFIVDDDGDDSVLDMFLSRGQDYFTRIATLTIKGGAQAGPDTSTDSDAVFCDTIAISNEFWITEIEVVDYNGADRIARIKLDLCGYNTVAFVGITTVDDTTLVQAAGY